MYNRIDGEKIESSPISITSQADLELDADFG